MARNRRLAAVPYLLGLLQLCCSVHNVLCDPSAGSGGEGGDDPVIEATEAQVLTVLTSTESGDIRDQYIVQEAHNLSLRCQGKHLMKWDWEEGEEPDDQRQRYLVGNIEVVPDADLPYITILTISSLVFTDTGRITCRYQTSVGEASLYLFVESVKQLFRKDKYFTQVNVARHHPTFLGCRPTSPWVRLRILDQKSRDITQTLGTFNMRYTQQSGLWILQATVHEAGTITCQAVLDRIESKQLLFLNIMDSAEDPLPRPRIAEVLPPGPQLGGFLFLTCTVEVHINLYTRGVILTWTTPSDTWDQDVASGRIVVGERITGKTAGKKDSTRVTRSPPDDMRTVSRNITIKNLTSSDNGTYTCTVSAPHVEEPSREYVFVRIYRPGEVFISDFSFGGGGSLIRIKDAKDEVKWFFEVETIPRERTTFSWLLPSGEEVPHRELEKYSQEVDGNKVKLVIKDVTIEDMGPYLFIVTVTSEDGHRETKQTELELVVGQNPRVNVSVLGHNQTFFFQKQEFYQLVCQVTGHPVDNRSLSLVFYPCSDFRTCNTSQVTSFTPSELVAVDRVANPLYHYQFESRTLVQAETSGQFECRACSTGQTVCNSTSFPFFLSESRSGFEILDWSSPKQGELVEGDSLRLTCAASRYNYSGVTWTWNHQGEVADLRVPPVSSTSAWSHVAVLQLANVSLADSGAYVCKAARRPAAAAATDGDQGGGVRAERRTASVSVLTVIPPAARRTNLNNTDIFSHGEIEYELYCDVDGRPTPLLNWFKDGVLLNGTEAGDGRALEFTDGGKTLRFHYLKPRDSGLYTCVAENRGGRLEMWTQLVVEDNTADTALYLIVGGSVGGLILLSLILVAVWKIRVYQRKLRVLTTAELHFFEAGDPGSINPEMGVDEQAELLPYNRCVEFPKERLKLGKQLGSGAFGRVLKAEATGIVPWEPVSIVAVKMVKPQADITYIKALMSELKIMAALGKHLNIVNLLGACTTSLNRRELLVIVEYCRFGNLQKYLIHHRNTFINQIDPQTGLIDFSIGRHINSTGEEVDYPRERERHENSAHYVRSASQWEEDNSGAVPPGYLDMSSAQSPRHNADPDAADAAAPVNGTDGTTPAASAATAIERRRHPLAPSRSVRYTREPYLASAGGELGSDMTEITNVVMTGDTEAERSSRTYSMGSRLSRTGPGWRSNIRGDYSQGQDVKPITTKDLLCWAYQVTRGMEYLASKKVMHGDLACRNILLAADNVVKICDFGLAKDIYRTNNYHKKTDGPLPVKWLAVECLRDRIFSTQSDVWAFGIVLWEMFTLGKTPYPGIEPGERFYDMLVDGYRMPKPHFAPRDIYKTMLSCWDADPVKRPRFLELTGIFGDLLEEGEKENYIILGERFEQENRERRGGETQYLAMMSQPDYQRMTSSCYDGVEEDAGYLVPNRMNNNSSSQKELAVEDGYLVPTSPGFQETTFSRPLIGEPAANGREPYKKLQGIAEESVELLSPE